MPTSQKTPWKWYGQAGHFCSAERCLYHLHTHVGGYCVSTIGEYYVKGILPGDRYGIPDEDGRVPRGCEKPTPPGASPHLYETMVFVLDADGENVADHNEVATRRSYNRAEAQAAHMALCEEYARKGAVRAH